MTDAPLSDAGLILKEQADFCPEVSPTVFRRSASPLKSGLSRFVLLRVMWTRFLPREAEPLDDLAHPVRVIATLKRFS